MLRQTLQNYEQLQAHKKSLGYNDVDQHSGRVDARPHTHKVVSDELFCCLADKCAGVQKVYSEYDRRRAQRPYQHEDYCLEAPCRYRRDKFSPLSDCCTACGLILAENLRRNGSALCVGCSAAKEQCAPQVPCQDRFRRNVISTVGTWRNAYYRLDETHKRLTGGAARDLIAYNTLAQWKYEFDQGYPSTACANDCL